MTQSGRDEASGQQRSAESEALARYRAAARRSRTASRAPGRRRAGRTPADAIGSPGPGPRDPRRAGDVWRALADGNGWTTDLAVWSLANRWAEIVGPQVAQHVTVLSFAATPDEEQAQPPRRSEVLPQAQQTVLLGDEAPVDDSADLRHGGKLTLIADDAAWQQQIVWGLPHLQRRLDAELGAGVVGRIVVLGPQERRRKYGSRRVKR